MWLSSRIKDPARVDAYLRAVRALFYESPELFSAEKALELLHRCNYDDRSALELVQPWAKAEDEEDGLTAGGGKVAEFDSDDACHVCGDGGDLIICDAKGCKRVYHAVCADLTEIPSGTWECPIHFCSTCGSVASPSRSAIVTILLHALTLVAAIFVCACSNRVNDSNSVRCVSCPTAFCATHIPACLLHSEIQSDL